MGSGKGARVTATFRIYDGGDVFPFDLSSYTVVLGQSGTFWQVRDPATGFVLSISGTGSATSGTMTDFLDANRPEANLSAVVTGLAVSTAQAVLSDNQRVWTASGLSLTVYPNDFFGRAATFAQVYDVDFNFATTSSVLGPIGYDAWNDNLQDFGGRIVLDWSYGNATSDTRNGGVELITPTSSSWMRISGLAR